MATCHCNSCILGSSSIIKIESGLLFGIARGCCWVSSEKQECGLLSFACCVDVNFPLIMIFCSLEARCDQFPVELRNFPRMPRRAYFAPTSLGIVQFYGLPYL